MTLLTRLTYSFFFAVIVVGCGVVLDTLIRLNIGEILFSPFFFGAALLVGLVVSPWLAKALPSSRKGK
jgi:hypothetical protein